MIGICWGEKPDSLQKSIILNELLVSQVIKITPNGGLNFI